MSFYHLTAASVHDAPHTALDLLTSSTDNLTAQYNSFILNVQIELSPATAQDYRYKLRYFIDFCHCCGIASILNITTDLGRAFIAYNKQRLKPVSVQDYFKVASCFINWLVEEERLSVNPWQKIKTPAAPEVIIKIFNAEHIRKILLLCEGGTRINIRNRAMILVLLDTGMRISELTNINVSDIDIQQGIIKIMGKGARERVVGISRTTLKAIIKYFESRPGNHQQLFLTEEGKPISIGGIAQVFKTLKKRAGFTDVRLSAHTFRHTSGTMELLNGASERDVQLLLGHRTPKMTRHYTATITSLNIIGRHKDFSPVNKLRLK